MRERERAGHRDRRVMDIGARLLDEKGVFLPDSFRADNLHPQGEWLRDLGRGRQPETRTADQMIWNGRRPWNILSPIL